MGLKRRTSSSTNKTQPTRMSASAFIAGLGNEARKAECKTLMSLMEDITGEKPVMWGSSIVGFGSYHYKYDSGREGDAPRAGFSPRKQALTVYCMPGFGSLQGLLRKLGPHKHSVSCLYIKRLADVDLDVLRDIVQSSVDEMAERYPE